MMAGQGYHLEVATTKAEDAIDMNPAKSRVVTILKKLEERIHTLDGLLPAVNIFEDDVLVTDKWDHLTIRPAQAGSGRPLKSRKVYASNHPGEEGRQGRLQLEVVTKHHMPYKINIHKEDGSTTTKTLTDCAEHGLMVLHHPETIKVYECVELADSLRAVYSEINLRSDWDEWNMDDTPPDIPWAGTPTVSDPAWDHLFASTNPEILQALKAHADSIKDTLPQKHKHKNKTINELGIFRYNDFFMHAFPRAQRVPGEGLIRVAQTVIHKGKPHIIHPFYTDRAALIDTESLAEEAADIMVESHTKDGFPFFLPTDATSSLPPTPNFGGGAARHITLLFSDPGIRGLSPAYMAKIKKDFPAHGFGFNRPINYRDVMGYKETHLDPATQPQDLARERAKQKTNTTITEAEAGPIKEPPNDQSKHTDLDVIQATKNPQCAVILAPVSNFARLHVTPMGHDILKALKQFVSDDGDMIDDPDVDFLDPDLSRAVQLSAPPNTNLSNGIPLDNVTLQMAQGSSCALLPCTPHAGAGLAERDTHRNIRIHIVLHKLPPPFPTHKDQSSAAYVSPPILRHFCGKRPSTHHPHNPCQAETLALHHSCTWPPFFLHSLTRTNSQVERKTQRPRPPRTWGPFRPCQHHGQDKYRGPSGTDT